MAAVIWSLLLAFVVCAAHAAVELSFGSKWLNGTSNYAWVAPGPMIGQNAQLHLFRVKAGNVASYSAAQQACNDLASEITEVSVAPPTAPFSNMLPNGIFQQAIFVAPSSCPPPDSTCAASPACKADCFWPADGRTFTSCRPCNAGDCSAESPECTMITNFVCVVTQAVQSSPGPLLPLPSENPPTTPPPVSTPSDQPIATVSQGKDGEGPGSFYLFISSDPSSLDSYSAAAEACTSVSNSTIKYTAPAATARVDITAVAPLPASTCFFFASETACYQAHVGDGCSEPPCLVDQGSCSQASCFICCANCAKAKKKHTGAIVGGVVGGVVFLAIVAVAVALLIKRSKSQGGSDDKALSSLAELGALGAADPALGGITGSVSLVCVPPSPKMEASYMSMAGRSVRLENSSQNVIVLLTPPSRLSIDWVNENLSLAGVQSGCILIFVHAITPGMNGRVPTIDEMSSPEAKLAFGSGRFRLVQDMYHSHDDFAAVPEPYSKLNRAAVLACSKLW